MEELSIRSLVDVPRLQRIQDRFSDATGFAMITIDYKGVPVTTASGFTPFCAAIRGDPALRHQCFKCDAHGGLQSAIDGRPYFYRCHTGLIDFSVPIMLGDHYLGAMLCGQVKPSAPCRAQLDPVIPADDSWRTDPDVVAKYEQIRETDLAQLRSVGDALFEIASYLVEKECRHAIRAALQESELRLARDPVRDPAPVGGVPGELEAGPRIHPDRMSRAALAPWAPAASRGPTMPPRAAGAADAVDFTELARALEDHDLVQALHVVGVFLDELFEVSGRFVGRLRLAELENSIVLLAQESSSQLGWELHQRVLRHRSRQDTQLSRYDWQRYLEGLLFAVFDDLAAQTPPQHRTLTDLLNHIERDVEHTLSLTKAAEYLSLSPSHLSRQFKAHTGRRFIDYVNARRLARAKLMLEYTDLPVCRIAETLGFQPVNYFSRAFRRETGMPPSQYRRIVAREAAVTTAPDGR